MRYGEHPLFRRAFQVPVPVSPGIHHQEGGLPYGIRTRGLGAYLPRTQGPALVAVTIKPLWKRQSAHLMALSRGAPILAPGGRASKGQRSVGLKSTRLGALPSSQPNHGCAKSLILMGYGIPHIRFCRGRGVGPNRQIAGLTRYRNHDIATSATAAPWAGATR